MDLLVLLTLAATCLASLSGHAVESQSQAEAYWIAKLGNTPMPKAIIDSLEASKDDPSTSEGLEAANIDKYDLERVLIYGRRDASASKEDPSTNGEGREAANIDKYDLERVLIYGRRDASASKEDPSTIGEGNEIDAKGLDIFFLDNHLTHPRGTLKLHFNRGCKSKFLPIQIAKLIPFSHDKVPEILSLFSVRPDSAQAKLMKEIIISCEESPIGGEDNKYCATSLEDLVDYVVSNIGSQVTVLSTTIDKDVTAEYTIEQAHKVRSDGNFVCHKARYPYAVFHCHRLRNTDAYAVSLIDANGQKSKAAAVCHRDTSSWNPEHLAFQLLKVEPGSVPICHFVGAHDMIWTWKDMPLATDQAQSL